MAENFLKKVSRLLHRDAEKKKQPDEGEEIAAQFLAGRGFRILERNFRSKYGEIDIVCRDGTAICFVEVKSRSSFLYGFPEEFVDRRKRKKLTLAALSYLKKSGVESAPMRFDVVAVDLSKNEVKLIEGAFEAEF